MILILSSCIEDENFTEKVLTLIHNCLGIGELNLELVIFRAMIQVLHAPYLSRFVLLIDPFEVADLESAECLKDLIELFISILGLE
jgi:type II restriction/modification system DNA methylase subunit YeeA